MPCALLVNVTLWAPGASSISRCGVVRPVGEPSIEMLHGGLVEIASVPALLLGAGDGDEKSTGASAGNFVAAAVAGAAA